MSTSTRYPYWFTLYAACALLLVIPAGCSRESGTGANHTVTREIVDGVEIISNFGMPLYGEVGKLEKVLSIGVEGTQEDDEESPYLFSRIGHGFVKEDQIYVLDLSMQQIRVFSAHGDFVKSVGRSGHGPGEFFNANQIHVDDNNNLYVRDRTDMKVFNEEGIYQQSIDIRTAYIGEDGVSYGVSSYIPVNPDDIMLNIYTVPPRQTPQTKRSIEELKGAFVRISNPQKMFWPPRAFSGLDETLSRLSDLSPRHPDFLDWFTQGLLYWSSSDMQLYYCRVAFPSEVLVYTLNSGLSQIINREPTKKDIVTIEELSRSQIESREFDKTIEGYLWRHDPLTSNYRNVFYYNEKCAGLFKSDELLFVLWNTGALMPDIQERYMDIYDVKNGKYLYRIKLDIDISSYFIGGDSNRNLYFTHSSPFPHVAKYSLNFEQ